MTTPSSGPPPTDPAKSAAAPGSAVEAPPLTRREARRERRRARLSTPKARGLTLLSVVAVLLSPFAIPTFGVGIGIGVFLIVVSIILERKGYRARGPLAAGVIAVVVGGASAGACGWFVLRTVEVTGGEERRQDRVEDRFDRAFENSERAPEGDGDPKTTTRDAGPPPDAQSPPTQERR